MFYPDAKIIVFAKTPETGKVKTRLIPALGATASKVFHCQMLEHTLQTIAANKITSVELHCAPDIENAYLKKLASQYNISLRSQQGNNLGERMFFALDQTLKASSCAILIGTDCPELDLQYIQQALDALQSGNDIVIGPADDGGYVLVGVTSSHPEIFTHINWGTSKVLEQTRIKIQHLGLRSHELKSLRDIDTPDDLIYLKQSRQFEHLLFNQDISVT